eukprot:scaffold1811_cov246-Pinguiococcus_pyrenoidosus.AAC.2
MPRSRTCIKAMKALGMELKNTLLRWRCQLISPRSSQSVSNDSSTLSWYSGSIWGISVICGSGRPSTEIGYPSPVSCTKARTPFLRGLGIAFQISSTFACSRTPP